jgi:hypothetical protein
MLTNIMGLLQVKLLSEKQELEDTMAGIQGIK